MITITNSELSTFKRCERLHYYRYVMLRALARSAQALTDGTSVHGWLEDFWKDLQDRRLPENPALRALCKGYAARYAGHTFQVLGVEKQLSFTVAHYGDDTIQNALKLDGLVRDAEGKLWVLEHKTSSQDTSAGSEYWQALRLDTQVSSYILACRIAGYPVEGVLYDVLNKSRLKQMKATPEADRKYTKPTKKEPVSRLYAGQREEDETDLEFEQRCLEDIAADPDKYYQRQYIKRTDEELIESAGELSEWALKAVENSRRVTLPVRNTSGCMKFNRLCDYFPVCSKAVSIESYPVLDRKHQELEGIE
jgi:hypothetical protein